jgi:UDP-N-acetylmuramoyl-tripeptide--D-alanyl-D-alanine ligase
MVWLVAAALWRRLMFRTTFVAITGSVGKTTAKNCIAAALSTRYRTVSTRGGSNHVRGVGATLFRVRPWHRYAVVEIGLGGPNQMKWFARVVRPDIAVWLSVARTHTDAFKTLDDAAREKARLVEALGSKGVAVLNADDEFVRSYARPSCSRVVWFGTCEQADIRASEVSAVWPERLAFSVHTPEGVARVPTRLVGTHWVPSVLAAIAVARECGVSTAAAAAAIARVEPHTARLSPAGTPNGAVFLRDEYNGSVDTLEPALRVFGEAAATRKILVVSDVSDSPVRPRRRVARLAARAAEFCDGAVFLGGHAHTGARAAVEAGMAPEQVRAFLSIEEAARYLGTELREGDLVLLRGRHSDHLSRLYLAQVTDVRCWREWCAKRGICDDCGELARAETKGG